MLKRLQKFLKTFDDPTHLLVLPHHNPDPDAIAAAVALRHLLHICCGVKVSIGYGGIIGRAENKALADYLKVPLIPWANITFHHYTALALVDTQPDAGNITLPDNLPVKIVIDHHSPPAPKPTVINSFVDIQTGIGATSTILTGYFQTTGLELPSWLATSLFYGIKTSTMSLGRNAGPTDAEAYFYLQNKIDADALAKIEQAKVSKNYFKSFDTALKNARIYKELVMSNVGRMEYPEMAAEMADLLWRLEASEWVVCVGQYKENLILSVRTRDRRRNAAQLVHALVSTDGVAGGHGTIAGGQIPLTHLSKKSTIHQITVRALHYLDIAPDTPGKSLLK